MDFVVNNLQYTTLTANTVSVSGLSGTSYNNLVIPSTVSYNGVTYTVTTIAVINSSTPITGSLTIPATVTDIQANAFGSQTMSSLYFPSTGSISIAYQAFINCDSLLDIYLGGCALTIASQAFTVKRTVKIKRNVYTPDLSSFCRIQYVRTDGTFCYNNGGKLYCAGSEVVNLVVPNDIVDINLGAFFGYSNIQTVAFGQNLRTIGDYAFYNLNIESISFSEGLQSIGGYSFYRSYSLTGALNLPASLQTIGNYSFYQSNIGQDVQDYQLTINNAYIGQNAFGGCKYIKTLVIGNSVTEIGKNAFQNCSALTSAEIGTGVTKICQGALSSCPYVEMKETTPPVFEANVYNASAKILVPLGSVSAYRSVSQLEYCADNIVSNAKITYISQEQTYDEQNYEYGQTIVPPAEPSAPQDKVFYDWSPALPQTMPDQNMTVTAVFGTPYITFYVDDVYYTTITQEAGTPLTPPTEPSKTGYTFNGWSPGFPSVMPSNKQRYDALFLVNYYDMDFYSDGSLYLQKTLAYGTALTPPSTDPSKTGYTFEGWTPELPATVPAENRRFDAVFQAIPHTLSFYENDTLVGTVTGVYGDPVVAPVIDRPTFIRWRPEVPATMPNEDQSFRALYYTSPFQLPPFKYWPISTTEVAVDYVISDSLPETLEIPSTAYCSKKDFTYIVRRTVDYPSFSLIARHGVKTLLLNKNLNQLTPASFQNSRIQEVRFNSSISVYSFDILIESYSFAGCRLEQYFNRDIEVNATMEDGIFKDNTTLKRVVLTDTHSLIDPRSMFEGCSALESLTLPRGITTIGDHFFNGCGMSEVDIPDTVTSFGFMTFSNTNMKVNIYSATPPSATADTFTNGNVTICVYPSLMSTYRAAYGSYGVSFEEMTPKPYVALSNEFLNNNNSLTSYYYGVDTLVSHVRNGLKFELTGNFTFIPAAIPGTVTVMFMNYGRIDPSSTHFRITDEFGIYRLRIQEVAATDNYGVVWSQLPTINTHTSARLYTYQWIYQVPQKTIQMSVTSAGGVASWTSFWVNRTPKMTIRFIVNGQTIYSEEIWPGDEITNIPELPVLPHKKDSYWEGIPEDNIMPDHNVDVIGVYIDYSVTFIALGQVISTRTYEYGETIILPPSVPPLEHYVFDHWDPTPVTTMTDGDKTYTAVYLGNPHTITYMVQGDVYRVVNTRYGESISLIDCPDVPHKKNLGWDRTLPATMPDEDIVVTGVYGDYSVTFVAQGSVISSRTYAYGETIIVPTAPAKAHYVFDHWDPTPVQTMTDGDKTYTAVYLGNPHTITYRVDGQTWRVQNVRYDDVISAPDAPAKAHYTFEGWTPALPATVPDRDLIVDAVYEPITYYITFKYEGVELLKVGYPYNTTVTPPTQQLEEIKRGYYVSSYNPELPSVMPGFDFDCEITYDLKTYYITYVVDNQTYRRLGYLYSMPIQVPVVPPKSGYYAFWDYVPATMPWNDITVTAVYIAEGDAEIITDWPIFREKLVRNTDSDVRKGNIIGDTFTRPATLASYDASTGEAYYLDNVAVLLTDSTDTITTNYFYKRLNGTEDPTVDVELPVKTPDGNLYKADWLQSRTQNGVIFFLGSSFEDTTTIYYLQLEEYLEQYQGEFYQVLTNSVTGSHHRGNLVHVKSEIASWSGQYYESAYPKWQRNITSADDGRVYKFYIPQGQLTRRTVIVRPAGNTPYQPDFSYGDEPWPYVMYPQGVRLYREYDSDMFEALFEWYDEDDYPIQAMSKDGQTFVVMTAGATSAGDNYTTLWMMSDGVIFDVIRKPAGSSITSWPSYSRDGYTFSGVSTTSGGSAISLPYTVPSSSTKLYILWTAIPVPPTPQPTPIWTLTYKVLGSVYATVQIPDNELVASYRPAAPSVSGYSFTGWSNEPVRATANATINANFSQVATGVHTLTYKIGNTVISTMSVATGDVIPVLPYPTRAGYTFDGWTGFPNDMIMPANALTITGSWTAKPDPLAS